MNAQVNGERREFPAGTTVATLLQHIGVDPERGIAVAVNERVVRGATFAAHELCDGDTVEVIRAVAGG
ncbi:MAG: sulfur carrier protein ThiS [Candidatus Eremiobacteraeota bacterium]|nr:sulfur carrier protein ThiS [Candidatus Eremiobacteraeota bacterium]